MTRSRMLTAIALVTCALVAGCGGDDEGGADSGSDAPTPTKAEFVEQGNAICQKGNQEIATAAQELGNSPTEEDITQFATDTLVPNIRQQVSDIRDLGFPEGDEEKLGGLLDESDAKLDEIEDDPASIQSSEDPFADINAELKAYGLTACAG